MVSRRDSHASACLRIFRSFSASGPVPAAATTNGCCSGPAFRACSSGRALPAATKACSRPKTVRRARRATRFRVAGRRARSSAAAPKGQGHHKWRTQRGTLKRFKAVRFEIAGATLDKKLSLSDKSVRRVNRSTHDGISAKALRLSCSDVKAVSCTRLSDTLEQKRAVCCRRRQPGALAARSCLPHRQRSLVD